MDVTKTKIHTKTDLKIRTRIKRSGCILFVFFVILGSLSGCQTKDGRDQRFALAVEKRPEKLDPLVAKLPSERLAVLHCFEGLTRLQPDGSVVPAAAVRWEVSSDGQRVMFYLRENTWQLHPSTETWLGKEATEDLELQVRADDFVFGLERWLAPGAAAAVPEILLQIQGAQKYHTGRAQTISGLVARDARTLELTLTQAAQGREEALLFALAQPTAAPCHRAFFAAARGRYGLSPGRLLCNGAFYFSVQGETSVTLARSESRRATTAPASLRLRSVTKEEQLSQFLEGTLDAATLPAELMTEGLSENYEHVPLGAVRKALMFRVRAGSVLANEALRVGLCAALDRAALGLRAEQELLPSYVRVGTADYRALVGRPQGISYDPKRAEKLFAGGHLETGALTLEILCAPEEEPFFRRALQQWQKFLGLSLTVHLTVESERDLEGVTRGDFDLVVTELSGGRFRYEAAEALLELIQGSGVSLAAAQIQPILKRLIQAEALQDQTEEAAKQVLAAEEALLQTALLYPLGEAHRELLFGAGVTEVEVFPDGTLFFGNAKKF